MTYLPAFLNTVVFIMMLAVPVSASGDFRPVVIYQGDIRKNSYNQTIHEGVLEFSRDSGVKVTEIVVGLKMQNYLDALDEVCRKGYSPVALIYADHLKNLNQYLDNYPDIRFLALGKLVDKPNLVSFDFAEHEGSFLAGALAAMKSETGTLGFVSITDIALMRRFACGFEQGARYINPQAEVLIDFVGKYPGAWFDRPAAAAVADRLMDQGADVIFQVAGGAGKGVLEAAAKRDKLAIGVDRNQNGLYPGHVLSSMFKRTDRVIYAALVHSRKGIWRDNVKSFGVTQDAVGLSFDEHNAALVTPGMRKRIEKIKSDIALGKIKIHDFITDSSCPR